MIDGASLSGVHVLRVAEPERVELLSLHGDLAVAELDGDTLALGVDGGDHAGLAVLDATEGANVGAVMALLLRLGRVEAALEGDHVAAMQLLLAGHLAVPVLGLHGDPLRGQLADVQTSLLGGGVEGIDLGVAAVGEQQDAVQPPSPRPIRSRSQRSTAAARAA